MLNKSVVRIALCLTILMLVGVTALVAGSKKNFELSADGRRITALHAPSHITPQDPNADAGLTTIAGNLSLYPYGTYFCCYGNTLAEGPPNFPFTTWVAIPFTPTANATITRVKVPIAYYDSTQPAFDVSIDNDDNGLPGTVIKGWQTNALFEYGECCTIEVVNDAAGIPVTAGTQYWIAVTTSSKTDFFGAWPFNSTDMRSLPIAGYCAGSSTYCGANSGKWVLGTEVQPAYGIFGH